MIEQVINDKDVIAYYEAIKKYEDKRTVYAYHGREHALNVMKISETLLEELKYNKEVIQDAKIAALLHDLGCYCGKANHEQRSFLIASKIIDKKKIKLNNERAVLTAIKEHRNNFLSNNFLTKVLMLADKLDITKDRVAKGGYNVIGMRQLQYINNISINIRNDILIINFITDSKINLDELKCFYFMKKVYKSAQKFAEYLNLQFAIKINDVIWEVEYNE